MKCPTCSCENFFIKDADDEYEIYEFSCSEGKIKFDAGLDKQEVPEITNETETYCNKCAWHGKLDTITSL